MTRKTVFWSRTVAIAAVAVSSLGLAGCLEAPNYPVVPKIFFDNIALKSYRNPIDPRDDPRDTVRVTVGFEDGDGDLGLGGALGILPDDIKFPYAYKNADSTLNRYHNNYFVDVYLKNRITGAFEKLPANRLPGRGYSGRHPRLTSSDTKPAPLKGTITCTFIFSLSTPFQPGDEARFDVTIADRALHESNTITTSSIVIPPR